MRLPVAPEFTPVHVCASEIVWRLASRKGIEPLTPGLGNLCSILLSYRDLKMNAAAAKTPVDAEAATRQGP
jgi:hypothetical protein